MESSEGRTMSMLTLTLIAADLAAFMPFEGVIMPRGWFSVCWVAWCTAAAVLTCAASLDEHSGVEVAGLPSPCCGQTLQVEICTVLYTSTSLLPSFSFHILRCDELHRIIEI